MNLDELKLTRRNFLKLLGVGAAGAAVPGLDLLVKQPTMPCIPPMETQSFTEFLPMHPAWRMIRESILGTALILPHNAQGIGTMRLFWTGEGEAEFGWWADWLTFDRGQAIEREAIPPTICTFPSSGLEAVTRSDLGTIDMRPGEMLNINLCSPDPSSPFKVLPGGQQIYGLELNYEQGW